MFMLNSWTIHVLYKIGCPKSCKNCKNGGSGGGKPVNSDGVCEYFCSPKGYCGTGNAYKRGDDCSSCKSGKCFHLFKFEFFFEHFYDLIMFINCIQVLNFIFSKEKVHFGSQGSRRMSKRI